MVIGFKESMKLFLDYDLLASVWPQKRNWFKGADTVSLLAFLEDNLTKEIPGLKDDQIWTGNITSFLNARAFVAKKDLRGSTYSQGYILFGRHQLPSLNPLAWATQQSGDLLEEYVYRAGPYQFEPFTPGSSLYRLRGTSCPFVGTTPLLHRQSLSFC